MTIKFLYLYKHIVIFIISLILYIYAPSEYNYYFCLSIFIIFLIQIIPFLKTNSLGNYVNFYTLFFISFFFVNLLYPVFLYPINPEFFSTFTLPFNENYISKGTALMQVSTSSLVMGVMYVKKNSLNISFKIYKYNSSNILSILLFTVLFLYIFTVGEEFLSGNFIGQSAISNYVHLILKSLLILISILIFNGCNQYKYNYLYWGTAVVYIFIFLSIGDRGPALILILLIIGLFSAYVREIPLKYLIIGLIFGIVLFDVIGHGRVDYTNPDQNIISRGLSNVETDNYLEFTRSFVINNRNLYVGLEYVENNGLNWGETSFLPSLIGVVPFGQSTYENLSGENLQSSSIFFTELTFGKNPPYGLGTNLIADIYISFGIIGTILGFFFLGFIVEKHRYKSFQLNNFNSKIIYFTLLSMSVHLPRFILFSPLSIIIWTILAYVILRNLKIISVKKTMK